MWVLLVLVCIVTVLLGYVKVSRKRKYPPSPGLSWPIMGHRLLTKKLSKEKGSLEAALAHLAKECDTQVLAIQISGNYTVIVFGEKLVKRVFLGKEFQARPRNYFNTLRSLGTNKGITMTDGELWHVHRSFVMKQLSDLGLGGTIMDSLLQNEFKNLLNGLGNGGERVNFSEKINQRTINVLWQMVAGKTMQEDDLKQLVDLMTQRSKAFDIAGGYLAQMPWLRFIAPEASGFKLIEKINNQLKNLIIKTIESHKASYDEKVTRDYIDAFLHEMNKQEENSLFTEDQLIMMCLDLFIAGLQTSTHAVEFSILRMVNHPDIQAKVQAELDTVFLPNQIPSFRDRVKLPYTNAVITEILRASEIIPLIGPRRALWDTELDGYFIPKGTTIISHMVSVTKDPKIWPQPKEFLPERFIEDTDGENLQFYPFSYGKRRCPGEVLARSFVFVFFSGLLHFYKIEPVKGQMAPTLIPIPGITNTPKPYELRLVRRHPA